MSICEHHYITDGKSAVLNQTVICSVRLKHCHSMYTISMETSWNSNSAAAHFMGIVFDQPFVQATSVNVLSFSAMGPSSVKLPCEDELSFLFTWPFAWPLAWPLAWLLACPLAWPLATPFSVVIGDSGWVLSVPFSASLVFIYNTEEIAH